MDKQRQTYYAPDSDPYAQTRAEKDFMRGDPFPGVDLPTTIGPIFSPDFDLLETTGEYLLLADLPGLEIGDLDIELTANSLTITACHALERRFGCFLRRFNFPEGVDGAKSLVSMVNGVLAIEVPKRMEGLPDC